MTTPTVTVVIPTRNRLNLLRRTLGTVLDQVGVGVEIIIVDDASTDGTGEMVEAIGDPRVELVRRETRGGVSHARNSGIDRARGEWIAFLDDDDLWAPDKLASQLAEATALGRRWAYSGSVAVASETLEVTGGGPPPTAESAVRALPWRNSVLGGASSVMARRRLLEDTGGFDPDLRHMADWDLWIRLATVGGLPAIVPRPLLAYVQHSANASSDTRDIPDELRIVEDRYAGLRGGRPADRAYVQRWMAWNQIRAGQRMAAIRHYAAAVASGDVKSIARIAVTAVHPSISSWVRRRQRPPDEWRAAAETWLRAIPR